VSPGTKRVTIRLGNDIREYFYKQVENAGGGNYQTLIDDALRAFIHGKTLETSLRKIILEELRKVS
jgi:uncharacterized protein (DUF4415 family)